MKLGIINNSPHIFKSTKLLTKFFFFIMSLLSLTTLKNVVSHQATLQDSIQLAKIWQTPATFRVTLMIMFISKIVESKIVEFQLVNAS